MKKLFRGAMLGDRSSRWSVIAVVTAFLAAGYGQGAAGVSLGGETRASQQCLETGWVARFDDVFSQSDEGKAIAVDADGNSYVTGESCAVVDVDGMCYVTGCSTVKYDSNGNQLWLATFRGPGSWFNTPNAIAVDSSNNVYVTGSQCIQAGCGPEGWATAISTTPPSSTAPPANKSGSLGTVVWGAAVSMKRVRLLWTPREMFM
jgi:hypothetical protein